jgi:hypothetical protein
MRMEVINMEYAKFISLVEKKLQNPDESLKQKLVKAPKETLKELIGEEVPGNVTVHTPKENTLTFVIPYEGKREMSEDDLSEVSGGRAYPNSEWPWDLNVMAYGCPMSITLKDLKGGDKQ